MTCMNKAYGVTQVKGKAMDGRDWRDSTVLTVEQAAQVLGISRGLAYASARRFVATGGDGGLPAIRIGRRLLVPVNQLQGFLEDRR